MEHQTIGRRFVCPIVQATQGNIYCRLTDFRVKRYMYDSFLAASQRLANSRNQPFHVAMCPCLPVLCDMYRIFLMIVLDLPGRGLPVTQISKSSEHTTPCRLFGVKNTPTKTAWHHLLTSTFLGTHGWKGSPMGWTDSAIFCPPNITQVSKNSALFKVMYLVHWLDLILTDF